MIPNRISETMSEQDMEEVLAHIKAIEAKMPYLIGLTANERRTMLKAGDRSKTFIHKALDVGPQVEHHLPASVPLSEMRKDVELMNRLYPIKRALIQVTERLVDTHAQVASEAYAAALVIYRTTKAVQDTEGLKDAVADLGTRFARTKAQADDSADTTDSEQLASK